MLCIPPSSLLASAHQRCFSVTVTKAFRRDAGCGLGMEMDMEESLRKLHYTIVGVASEGLIRWREGMRVQGAQTSLRGRSAAWMMEGSNDKGNGIYISRSPAQVCNNEEARKNQCSAE
jgi:hypothetical protein